MAAEAMVGAFAGIIIFTIIFVIAIMALLVLAVIFWIFMIVDAAKRKFKSETDKIAWILIVVLVGIIGAIVYYFVVKRPDKH